MKTSKKLIVAFAAFAGLGALTLSGVPPVSAQGLPPIGLHRGERHPELVRALQSLRRTEFDLRRANHDFGGHRTRAADLCHQAQNQILIALQYDRN